MSAHRRLPSILAVLLAFGVLAAASSDDRKPRSADPLPPLLPTGTVEGKITLKAAPPRRMPRRYPGRGAKPARPLQSLPAVVYLKDAIDGVRSKKTSLTMTQRDTAFVPPVLVVSAGTEIRFPNGDEFFHNVFSYSGAKRFDLGRYPKGEAKSVDFDKGGVVKIYCEVHEFMRATVIVTPTGLHGIVDEEGRFRIEDVPAGRRTFVVWHADLGEKEVVVEVPEGGTGEITAELRGK